MNFVFLHLFLNHFPIIGEFVGLVLLAIFTFFSGTGAQGAIKNLPGVSNGLITRHLVAAIPALLFMEVAGAFSLVALWKIAGSASPGALVL